MNILSKLLKQFGMCIKINNIQVKEDDYRSRLMRDVTYSHDKLTIAINRFNSQTALDPINRVDLDSFPYMVWKPVNDLIDVRKRKKLFKNYLNFDTRMKAGAKFGNHFHDDLIESVEVIYGELIDGDNIYKKGDVAHYEKGQYHSPIATQDTLLRVLFKP